MNFFKSILLGLCVSIIAYFAMFSVALVMINVLPIIKFLAIGIGCGAMVYYMRKDSNQENDDVQDPK